MRWPCPGGRAGVHRPHRGGGHRHRVQPAQRAGRPVRGPAAAPAAGLRRLLVFADSRQDTAFQAGYIRDRARSVQVRRLIVQAVRDRAAAGAPPASFDSLVDEVFRAGLASGLYELPAGGRDAQMRTLRVCQWDVLNEIADDDARPPTLERLGLLTVAYPALEQMAAGEIGAVRDLLGGAGDAEARWFLGRLLDLLRRRGGIAHDLLGTLDPGTVSDLEEAGATVAFRGRPAGFSEANRDAAVADVVSMGPGSAAARLARTASGGTLAPDSCAAAVRATVAELADRKILTEVAVRSGRSAVRLWQLTPQAMEFRVPPASLARCRACHAVQPEGSAGRRCTTYNCAGVVEAWAGDPDDHEWRLACGGEPLAVAAAEHSGQVPAEAREQIEQDLEAGTLNLLVCTQTLELGVGLGQLLAVVLRNVPPRPSNYAQRAGRAGRREERVALVVTFAGGLPHDLYYYEHPTQMIRGSIRPPAFLLDNRRVIERHARALALELCGEDLPAWMGDLVDDTGKMTGTDAVAVALEHCHRQISTAVLATFRRGLAGTDLPWLDRSWAEALTRSWVADLDASLSAYRVRQQALLEEWAIAAASPARGSARDCAGTLVRIGAALDAMRKGDRERAYTLSHLGSVGFLPSYAFPTDTATLALTGHPTELGHDAVRAPRGVTQHALFDRRGADGVDRPGTLADFAWPDRRVAVFCDGWEHHSTPDQRAADTEKRTQARARGWAVLAFWGGQIVRDADACARQVIAALR